MKTSENAYIIFWLDAELRRTKFIRMKFGTKEF
jgi:hypothetical protein